MISSPFHRGARGRNGEPFQDAREFPVCVSRSAQFDILLRIPYDIPIKDAMERINLNVASDARKRLKIVAKRLGKTEAEVARELFLDGLDRAERSQFYDRVASEMTLEIRERMIVIAEAMERING
jgi:hypothetical protein